MERYIYLLVNLGCIIIPFATSFYKKHAFYKQWHAFFKANIIVALLFIIWDYFFTKAGIWSFNEDYLVGFFIGNLPIEEILFFICIPYACVFSYFAFQYLIKKNPLENIQSTINLLFIVTLFAVAVFNYSKLYTSVTFFSTSLFLCYLKIKKVNLSFHYLSYIFIFPFFFISNGILTGSFLIEPIVIYNDLENLGIRICNIPIEDTIYGMLLIFLNIELYNYFISKTKKPR